MDATATEAELVEARLEKADLRGAKLAQANLSGARLDGANLCGTDLRLARGLKQAQIDRAIGDHRTALPTDLTRPTAWLPGGEQGLSQPASQSHRTKRNSNESSDPYEILGVGRETSIQDIHVAWLKLVWAHYLKQQRGRSPRYALAAILLIAAIAVGTLIAAVETHLARQGDPGGGVPAARAIVKDGMLRLPLNAQQTPSR